MAVDSETFLEIVAGEICPCLHRHDEHEEPDPEFRLGNLVEIRGACTLCKCKGEVGNESDISLP